MTDYTSINYQLPLNKRSISLKPEEISKIPKETSYLPQAYLEQVRLMAKQMARDTKEKKEDNVNRFGQQFIPEERLKSPKVRNKEPIEISHQYLSEQNNFDIRSNPPNIDMS
eukprot:CAMPEP_0205802790 /NCGR_PEP_ID=MMETSP0205-20121125/5246_1 /ASSEMBLY_ACC=CAM_ASM_000278 /TAXON_ID=36767 /ORGANISM="Euplotes focardii, Strain TN1" /LENGTH=111 /DNA_ID=CAMNT_0053069825 /DNA_START=36 /DNA_END=371 /DNA_ORIENTATION=-